MIARLRRIWRRLSEEQPAEPEDLSAHRVTGSTIVTIPCLSRDSCERQFAALQTENTRLRRILATFLPPDA